MKRPGGAAFSPYPNEGINRMEYVYTEVLKSLIRPEMEYSDEEIDALISTARRITFKVFPKETIE